jgi:HAE1 family hydrophobic/amphiphilic exporter-1
MGLTRLAVERPLVIAMAIAALLLLGLRARARLPTELDPRVEIPTLTIMVGLPGAGPEEVERRVTRPIEDAVATISRVSKIFSSSQENVSYVGIDFEIGTNLDTAQADVRTRLDATRAELPDSATTPVTTKLDLNAQPVVVLGLTGRRPLADLRTLAEERLKPSLSEVPGVASVQVVGGEIREVRVAVDSARLDPAGLALSDVVASLRAASLAAPAGNVTGAGRELSIRANGEFHTLADIRRTPLLSAGAGLPLATPPATASPRPAAPLLLQDVATVSLAPAERETITHVDGRESIGLLISRAPDANTVAVAAGVRQVLADLHDELAEQGGAAVTVLRDQSTAVADALEDINGSLLLGSLLAIGVVWLFLRSLRDTAIIALAIPCSLIPTFLVMYFGGFTLNQMTMLGLSLSIGILVDDSILVLDSIHRHRAMGKPPRQAALDGRAEIGLADASNTFVDVIVFVPIAFMGGIVGQFFRQFGLTVATATLLSLYVSFSLTPMLAANWTGAGRKRRAAARPRADRRVAGPPAEARSPALAVAVGRAAVSLPPERGSETYPAPPAAPRPGAFERGFGQLEARYRRALAWALGHRGWVVAAGVGSLALALGAAAWGLGVDFVPPVDRGQVTVTVELPPGSPLAATDAVVRRVDSAAGSIPEVRARLASAGEIPPGFGTLPRRGSEVGQLALTLLDKPGLLDRLLGPWGTPGRQRSDEEVASQIRTILGRVPGARVTVAAVRAWSGGEPPLQVELSGPDLGRLAGIARDVQRVLSHVPGVRNPDVSLRTGRPELRADLDRDRAAELGITAAEVVTALRDAIQGNTEVRFRQGQHTYDVRVQIARLREAGPRALGALTVAQRGAAPVTLAEVATLHRDVGPTEITRKDRKRVVTVSADLAPGYALGNVQRAAARAIARVRRPGIGLRWGGEVDEMARSAWQLMSALLLATALAYMLLAALFNSLIHPLTIMLCLPMALVGAIVGLALAGETLNVVSMIGIIMLVGLVSKNAILLVDYTNTLRGRGLERDEAVRQAGPVRLRPILMTTLTAVLAMLPVALRIGRSAEMRAPMAVAVVGGLILSTLLTLLVVPVVYTLFDDLRQGAWRASPPEGNGA